jgi:hypothetical protein
MTPASLVCLLRCGPSCQGFERLEQGGGPADRSHIFVARRYRSGLLNFAAYSPEDCNATEDPVLRTSNEPD